MSLQGFRAASGRRARITSVGLALGLGSVLAGPLAAPATTALAATVSNPVTLPVSSFADMVVDGAHGHVFVSAPGSNEILVLDEAGTIVQTIANLAAPSAMVLDGSTLYVAETNAGSIDRIDTGTLAETTPLTTQGSLLHPTELAMADGALWTGVWHNDVSNSCVTRVDPSTGAVTVFTGACSYGLAIRSNPASSTMLITSTLGVEPATVTTYDVSSGSPVTLHSAFEERLQNLEDIAGGPTGNGFIAASGWPYEFDEYRYSDLQQNGIVYAASNYPTAVATTSAQGGLMAGGLDASYGNAVWVYRYDKPQYQLFSGVYGQQVAPRGLAFSPDGQLVFAVSSAWNGVTYVTTFTVVDLQIPPPPAVTASPVSATEGQSFSGVVGHFTGSAAPYTASVNWGDGSAAGNATVTADPSGGYDVTAQHVFAEEGTPTVSVTVTDATGGSTTASAAASVADAPLSVSVNTATQSSLSTSHVVATVTDADPGGAASDYTATVSLTQQGVPVGPAFTCPSTVCTITANATGGFDVTIASALPPGSYQTTVTVFDAGGATGFAAGTLTIS